MMKSVKIELKSNDEQIITKETGKRLVSKSKDSQNERELF